MEEKLKELLLQRKRKVIFDNHLKRSAVLIPFFIKDGEYHILFIKRSQEVENHKGEISFPGGLCEKGDEGLEETALRESFEETGIHPQDVSLLGTLDDEDYLNQLQGYTYCRCYPLSLLIYPTKGGG
jgi:8-oxo-dGTP pyrophosphatase MutT (NUDIX family)